MISLVLRCSGQDIHQAVKEGKFEVVKKILEEDSDLVHAVDINIKSMDRDLKDVWRNRLYDNRFIICLSGGYRQSKSWEFNLRWTWMGGKAFTPVNQEKSIKQGVPWIEVDDIMAGYLSDYKNLSFRIERRFYFKKTSFVIFAGAWNVFDHQNELYRWWNSWRNQYISEYMWGIIPYIGLEFEF